MAIFLPVLMLSVCFYSVKSEQSLMTKEQNCKMRVFRLVYSDVHALESNVIAQKAAEKLLDCGFPCITDTNCKAFNFKRKSSEVELNCQLTNTREHNFKESNVEGSATGWSFYQSDWEEQISSANQTVTGNKSVIQNNITQFGLTLDSAILSGEPHSFIGKLKTWLPGHHATNWTVCWRASRDGWNASIFHAGCDDKGPTLVVVKVHTYIFGGYTEASWKAPDIRGFDYKFARGSFIFSLRNKDDIGPFIAPLHKDEEGMENEDDNKDENDDEGEEDEIAIVARVDAGPSFGFFRDLHISDNANSNNDSVTNFGRSYKAPPGYGYLKPETVTLLAGTQHFSPSEVEVFYLHY